MKNFIKLDFPSGDVAYVNILNIIAITPTSETSTAIYLSGDVIKKKTEAIIRTSGSFQRIEAKSDISNHIQIETPISEILSMIEEAQRE